MPKQVLIALAIEVVLIFGTSLLLIQPASLFGQLTPKTRGVFKGAGLLLLCVMFCWSVIFGAIITLNQYMMRV